MLASEETKEIIRKHQVLTGFYRFILLALIAIVVNIVYSLWGPYKDYDAVYILAPTGIVLTFTLWLFKWGNPLFAKIISALTFNAAFLLISFHLGEQGGTYLYYFPFILAYVYLFRSSGKPVYTWTFTLFSLTCMTVCVLAVPHNSGNYIAPVEKIEEIFHMSFFISLVLTVYFFILIYNYQEKLYRRVEELENNNRIREMRLIIESQEKNNQQVMLELRDNINQILNASRILMEKSIEEPRNLTLISRSRELTNEAIHTLAMLCVKLYPAIITDVGLVEGIKQFIGEIRTISPVQIRFLQKGKGVEEIPDNDKIAVFRIIQDYLALLLKTSQATMVTITLNYQSKELILSFTQDDPDFRGMGSDHVFDFSGINNRIRYYKGRLSHHNDGQIETAEVILPLDFSG